MLTSAGRPPDLHRHEMTAASPGAVSRVQEAIRSEGLTADIVEVEVADANTARRVHFLGSPAIRVNGQDVEVAGVPPMEWIRAPMREAGNTSGSWA